MAIEFVCPACHGALRVPDESAGQVMRCGNCMTALRVPTDAPKEPEPIEPVFELERRSYPDNELAPRPRRIDRTDRIEEDDYGEPRPRRRRLVKKKSRGVLFWLVIILFGLGLFTCLACGGIWLAFSIPRWHTHESDEGHYRVDLPAPLNPGINQEVKLRQKPNEVIEGTVLAGRLELYWVAHSKVDLPAILAGDQAVLQAAVDGLVKENLGTVIRKAPKNVDGFPGQEVVIVHDGLTTHCLIVAARARVYIVAAGGPFVSAEGNSRIRRFLDSFHIIKNEPPKRNPFRGNAGRKDND